MEIEKLKQIYQQTLLSTKGYNKTTKLKVEFYPYVGINNRIRLRDDLIHVKLSDLLHDAPSEFHEALAEILVKKLYRKKVSPNALQTYRNFVKQTEVRDKSIAVKKNRGRKILNGAQGEHYDLEEIFAFLNQIYFQNNIPKPQLSWSANNTYRILGHHDSTHEVIVISKSLDDLHVPRYVVEYVVYHEMLHIKHPTRYENGRRYNHTPAFRSDEKDFAFFDEAEEWIEGNAIALKKKASQVKRKR
jgi:hypothetical protein